LASVPRFNEKGFNVLEEKPKRLKNVILAEKLKGNLELFKF